MSDVGGEDPEETTPDPFGDDRAPSGRFTPPGPRADDPFATRSFEPIDPPPDPIHIGPIAGTTSVAGGGRWPVLFAVVGVAAAVTSVVAFLVTRDDDSTSQTRSAPNEIDDTRPSTSTSEAPATSSPPTTLVGDLSGNLTIAELARSTVQVVLLDDGDPTCWGSGSFIDADGTILTNAHVVEPSDECPYDTIGVAVTDDAGNPPDLLYTATVYAYDRLLDIAVLRIDGAFSGDPIDRIFPALALGDSDAIEIGDDIRILGYPGIGGDTITFTNGVVSGFTGQNSLGARSWIKTDATIAGGNSGGSALDSSGRLIGVPTQAAASDDGPVVDCRVITDTNGDGRLTDADQCVPIGGFLNGIRPVGLALSLIEEATVADAIRIEDIEGPVEVDVSTVDFTNPRWSIDASDEPDFVREFIVTASAGVESLCLWFDWRGLPDGARWDALWVVDGEPVDDFSFFDQPWVLGDEGSDNWVCALDGQGLVSGIYELVFFVNGEVGFAESIRVTETPVALNLVDLVNDTDSDVCFVFISPVGATDTGLDELGPQEFMEPGDVVTLIIADGPIIIEVYDCNFDIVFGNFDGIPIVGPTTIEFSSSG